MENKDVVLPMTMRMMEKHQQELLTALESEGRNAVTGILGVPTERADEELATKINYSTDQAIQRIIASHRMPQLIQRLVNSPPTSLQGFRTLLMSLVAADSPVDLFRPSPES